MERTAGMLICHGDPCLELTVTWCFCRVILVIELLSFHDAPPQHRKVGMTGLDIYGYLDVKATSAAALLAIASPPKRRKIAVPESFRSVSHSNSNSTSNHTSISSSEQSLPTCPTHNRQCVARRIRAPGPNFDKTVHLCAVEDCNFQVMS